MTCFQANMCQNRSTQHRPLLEDDWPSAGGLTFDNAQLRYRPDLPLALQGVDIDVQPGEHIGVVGKTVCDHLFD
jgi:ABC-type bacteriocin/lantibiotic exporter with double-glycine peptidase domain